MNIYCQNPSVFWVKVFINSEISSRPSSQLLRQITSKVCSSCNAVSSLGQIPVRMFVTDSLSSVCRSLLSDFRSCLKPDYHGDYNDQATNWTIRASIPSWKRDLCLDENVHTDPGTHPAYCWVCSGGSFPGCKPPTVWRWQLTAQQEVSALVGLPALPLHAFMPCTGTVI